MPDKANKSSRERKKDSSKNKNSIYSSKHIRMKEKLIRNNATNNGGKNDIDGKNDINKN